MRDDFVRKFVSVFVEHSYNNHMFALLALHLILGRCTSNVMIPKKNLWIDGRISFWYFAPPSSGKSTPYDFIFGILNGIGEIISDVDDTSDAALIGHHDEEEQDVLIPGILDRGGVVHYDEAAFLLSKNQYSEKLKGFFQKALNPIGSESNTITREFKNDKVTINPTCSFYLTSYLPDGIVEEVLGTGMLQRILVLMKDVSTDDRRANSYVDISNLGEEPSTLKEDKEYFIKKFKHVQEKYNNPEVKFDWKIVKPLLRNYSDKLLNLSSRSPSNTRKLMETFQPRELDMLYILAMHYCCLRDDNVITIEDVEQAFVVISSCYSGILSWLEEEPNMKMNSHENKNTFNQVKKLYKDVKPENGEMSSSELIKHCCKLWSVTEPTVRKKLEPMVLSAEQGDEGLIKRKQGRAVYYKVRK